MVPTPNKPDQPSTDRYHGNAKPEPKYWVDIATAVFVFVAMVATGFAAYFTGQQWQTANRALVISERAFVHLHGDVPTATIDRATGTKYLMTTITLINSGNTRTRDLYILVRCATSPDKLVEPWGLLHQEEMEHLPQLIALKSPAPTVCYFKLDDIKAIADGKLHGMFWETSLIVIFLILVACTKLSSPFGSIWEASAKSPSPSRRHSCQ